MAADESTQLGDQPSNLGPLTLDHLRADAVALSRRFATAPRAALFRDARHLRDRVFTLLDARQRVAESRDLYLLAGASLGMLAEASDDLGNRNAAMAHARTGLMCATESGHAGLLAWIRCEQAMIAFRDGRPAQAVEYTRLGEELGARSSVAARLLAMRARAAGHLGDAGTVHTALEAATTARDLTRPDELDTVFAGILFFPPPKQHFYAAQAHLGLGAGSDVIAAAEACLTGYRSGPAEERAYDNEAMARVNLATAHVLAGDLDAAQDSAGPALAIRPDLRSDPIDLELRRLHHALTAPAVATAPVARALRDRIEDFLATGGHLLPA